MINKVIIYDLSCPITGEIRYIGKTNRTINERLTQHICDSKRKNNHVQCWIKNLSKQNLKPIISIIDEVDIEDWVFWEQHYISLFKFYGFDLCNHTIGGEQPINMNSPKAIAKRLESLKTSKAWKNKHICQSELMKQKHKEGTSKFGYSHLSKETRMFIGKKIVENRPSRTILDIKTPNNDVLHFESIKNAVEYFKCNLGTFRDFIYNKRVSKRFKNYEIININKNKYDKK